MHWKYKTERSTRDRKHSPLTWDLAIWGAVLGKDLTWVKFVCYRGGEGVPLPGTPRIWGELQIQVKHHPPGHQLWDRHSFPQENCPELWVAPWRRAQGREGLGWPQPLIFFHVFCLLALKQESKGCGAGWAGSGKRGQKLVCLSPLRASAVEQMLSSSSSASSSANLITEMHFWKTKWG